MTSRFDTGRCVMAWGVLMSEQAGRIHVKLGLLNTCGCSVCISGHPVLV